MGKIQKLKKTHLNIFYGAVLERDKNLVPVVDQLTKNITISENKLAQVLEIELSWLRNNLYQLYNVGLVNFKRKRDDEFGIYTYFWELNKERIKTVTIKKLNEKITKQKNLLEHYKNKIFFSCESNCMLVDSEKCLNLNYTCPECGEVLKEMKIDKKKIDKIKDVIKKSKEQLKKISIL